MVGLQARHLLQGELSPFLWGTAYQSSLDALLAAALFLVTGTKPLVLLCIPLVGMLLMVALAFDVVRRRTSPERAFLAVLPLVFATMAINTPMLYVLRQTMITTVVAGLWLLDGAGHERGWGAYLRYAAGCALVGLAVSIDFFAAVLVPATGLFAFACCLDGGAPGWTSAKRWLACGAGAALAAATYLLLRPPQPLLEAGIDPYRYLFNWRLLWRQCLPFALGYKVFVPGEQLTAQLWQLPAPIRWAQAGAAVLLGAGIVFGLVSLALRRLPWEVRRLGALGFCAGATAVAAFSPPSRRTCGPRATWRRSCGCRRSL